MPVVISRIAAYGAEIFNGKRLRVVSVFNKELAPFLLQRKARFSEPFDLRLLAALKEKEL